jgi:hypothetical protein
MTNIGDEVRVKFDLQVEDGFPPICAETLIGVLERPNVVRIDNTPFFVEGVALGDIVLCSGTAPEFNYENLQKTSGNKAIAIIFIQSCEEEIYQSLRSRGCYCEFGEFPEFDMLAACVPVDVDYNPIRAKLLEYQKAGKLSLAELCIV